MKLTIYAPERTANYLRQKIKSETEMISHEQNENFTENIGDKMTVSPTLSPKSKKLVSDKSQK